MFLLEQLLYSVLNGNRTRNRGQQAGQAQCLNRFDSHPFRRLAVNPARPDILEALQKADCVPLKTIEELRDTAYAIVGEPQKVEFEDRVVGIIEARDGTIIDVVRKVKEI